VSSYTELIPRLVKFLHQKPPKTHIPQYFPDYVLRKTHLPHALKTIDKHCLHKLNTNLASKTTKNPYFTALPKLRTT